MEHYKVEPVYEIMKFKKEGKKIFYIEGVFDNFHEGHEAFLKYIRSKIKHFYGDDFVLLVGIESDIKTKRKKGKTRPIEDEFTRCKKVENSGLVDLVYINDNDLRFLIDDLKRLQVDYLVFPGEYIKHLKLFLIIKNRLRKSGIRVVLSRHKQYDKYGISKNLSLIHTSDIIKTGIFGKIGVKFHHITYLVKESLILLLR